MEPIPFCSDAGVLTYCPDLDQYKVDPVRNVSRSPSSSDDEGLGGAKKRSVKRSNPKDVLSQVAKAVTAYKHGSEHGVPSLEQAWSHCEPRFTLRSDDHFSDPIQNVVPPPPVLPPAPVSYHQPEQYGYQHHHHQQQQQPPDPMHVPSQHIPYGPPPSTLPPLSGAAVYPMTKMMPIDTYNAPASAPPAMHRRAPHRTPPPPYY